RLPAHCCSLALPRRGEPCASPCASFWGELPHVPLDLPPLVDTVVVEAARLPPSPADKAFSIVTIDGEAIATAPRLDQALTATPGVQLFRRTSSQASNPTTQGISVRSIAGSGASRALVLLDGVPQN